VLLELLAKLPGPEIALGTRLEIRALLESFLETLERRAGSEQAHPYRDVLPQGPAGDLLLQIRGEFVRGLGRPSGIDRQRIDRDGFQRLRGHVESP